MHLLNTKTLQRENFPDPQQIPPYAALSHFLRRSDDISFEEYNTEAAKTKPRYQKIRNLCSLAEKNNIDYAWINFCCVDHGNTEELSKSINSTFNLWVEAEVCYALLHDVPYSTWKKDFPRSVWFTRGWLVPELLTPKTLIFISSEWKVIGSRNDPECTRLINCATEIDPKFLRNDEHLSRRQLIDQASIAEKWKWAAGTRTKRPEDRAYSMLSIFDVSMKVNYGEGNKALDRLGVLVIKKLREMDGDYSGLLSWGCAMRRNMRRKAENCELLAQGEVRPEYRRFEGLDTPSFRCRQRAGGYHLQVTGIQSRRERKE